MCPMFQFFLTGPHLAGMPGCKGGPTPIIRMFGITLEGNSVLCHIHGFVPYLYTPAPPNFQVDDCQIFQEALNKAIIADMRSNKDNISQVCQYLLVKFCKL